MKQDIIYSCKYIIKNTIFVVQSSYAGYCSEDGAKEFEEKAYKLIKKATESDISEAYDECVECGIEEQEITANEVLKVIGGKAETKYESLAIDSVNVIKEI